VPEEPAPNPHQGEDSLEGSRVVPRGEGEAFVPEGLLDQGSPGETMADRATGLPLPVGQRIPLRRCAVEGRDPQAHVPVRARHAATDSNRNSVRSVSIRFIVCFNPP